MDSTPFYAESGGQVGDSGILEWCGERFRVLDTRKENGVPVHFIDRLPEHPQLNCRAIVDANRRLNITRNHSATHLLHAALREILGKHVEQKGSLVHADYLRFDFSHFAKINASELASIEERVKIGRAHV